MMLSAITPANSIVIHHSSEKYPVRRWIAGVGPAMASGKSGETA